MYGLRVNASGWCVPRHQVVFLQQLLSGARQPVTHYGCMAKGQGADLQCFATKEVQQTKNVSKQNGDLQKNYPTSQLSEFLEKKLLSHSRSLLKCCAKAGHSYSVLAPIATSRAEAGLVFCTAADQISELFSTAGGPKCCGYMGKPSNQNRWTPNRQVCSGLGSGSSKPAGRQQQQQCRWQQWLLAC